MTDSDGPTALLAEIVRGVAPDLGFTVAEIGARPTEPERFYRLLDWFPASRVLAFEPDDDLCERLNRDSVAGVTFYPTALGVTQEKRPFYETESPACSSLYRPNEALLSRFNGMEHARLKAVREIETVSLDWFVSRHDVGAVDFIKIDVQGAELDVFRGATRTLRDTLVIVSEALYLPHYEGQPLFGDICRHLSGAGFAFHKIMSFGGRTLKPIVLNGNPYAIGQHIWSDVLFIRDLFAEPAPTAQQWLKIAVLASLFEAIDVSLYCCREFDLRQGTSIGRQFLDRLNRAR